MVDVVSQSYSARAARHAQPVARQLLQIMARKRSNLCVSVDVTTASKLLEIVDAVGPFACLIKTHVDILSDFSEDFIKELSHLSRQHDFLLFEDRKIADIGSTAQLQYTAGIYRIAEWAHIVNAHALPGPGVIEALKLGAAKQASTRALLLIGEMSSRGSLATGAYTEATVAMARQHRDFVIGFIAQSRIAQKGSTDEDDFLILSPGINLEDTGDALGQQYRSPSEVIGRAGCDIAIVGRGIYGQDRSKDAIRQEAQRYQEAAWRAYEERLVPS